MSSSDDVVFQSGAERGRGSGIGELWPAVCLFLLGLVALIYVSFRAAADDGHFIIIAPFHYDKFDSLNLLAQVDETVPVSMGRWDNIIFANSEDKDFIPKMKQAGALWVLPVPNLSGCLEDRSLGAKV